MHMSSVDVLMDGATSAAMIPLQSGDLLWLAVVFVALAILAAVLGAGGIAGLSMDIAKWLVIIFVVLAIVTFFL